MIARAFSDAVQAGQCLSLLVFARSHSGEALEIAIKVRGAADERVELTATPAEGWRFAGWHSRYWSDNSRETDIDIYRDMTIEARFVEIEPDDD